MTKLKIVVVTAIVLTLTVGFCGCTTYDNFKAAFIDKNSESTTSITIGVFEPMSGSDKEDAAKEIEGIELAHELYPNVNGKIIELEYADNNSDIDASKTAIENLIAKDPKVILGSCKSVYSLVAAEYIDEAKIPTIAATNTNPLVTKHYDYYFRVCYVDSNQGDLLARYVLTDKKEETAGILLASNDDVAMAMATEFSDRMEAETDDDSAIACYETYDTGSDDYSDVLKAVEKSGVKSVLVAGETNDAVKIINQAASMDLDVQFLGETDWGDEAFCEQLSENVKASNLAFVQFFSSDVAEDDTSAAVSEQRQKFLDAYHAKHGADAEPDEEVALGFDAYFVAVDAIDKASDDADGEEIAEILKDPQYSFSGASGQINFSSIGDPIKTAYISTWAGNSITTISTVDPEK